MSANQTPSPGAVDTAPANLAHAGRMPRWAVRSSTIAGFLTQRVVGHDDIYVPLATTALAGALSATGYDKLANWPQTRLNYTETADVLNATAVAANTQTQVVAAKTFAVQSTAARLLVEVRCAVSVNAAALANFGLRANFDAGASTAKLSGAIVAAGGWDTLVGGVVQLVGFAAGNHTIQLQLIGSQASTVYCRASTAPNFEFASIVIVEYSP